MHAIILLQKWCWDRPQSWRYTWMQRQRYAWKGVPLLSMSISCGRIWHICATAPVQWRQLQSPSQNGSALSCWVERTLVLWRIRTIWQCIRWWIQVGIIGIFTVLGSFWNTDIISSESAWVHIIVICIATLLWGVHWLDGTLAVHKRNVAILCYLGVRRRLRSNACVFLSWDQDVMRWVGVI